MKALILAAGRGTRLGLGDDLPKCLVPIGTTTVLDRYLDVLAALEIPVTMVVGHASDRIEQYVAKRSGPPPQLVYNPRFAEGSVVSLATGLPSVLGHDVLLMDGDVAFTPSILRDLVSHPTTNALSVDIGTEFTDEQYMAGLRGPRVVALRRGPVPGHDAHGEWIGFARLAAETARTFADRVQAQVARGDSAGGYEDALAGVLNDVEFVAVPTRGAPWVEIDFPDDLARARALFAGDV